MEINNQNQLQITEIVKEGLIETAKWTKFLAILGFVGIGLMVILGFFMGGIMSSLGSLGSYDDTPNPFGMIGGAFFVILYLVIALIYYFPIKYLYDFSTKLKVALQIKDQQLFTDAIFKLKSHYKYIGILTIIIFGFYALMILFSIIVSIIGILAS